MELIARDDAHCKGKASCKRNCQLCEKLKALTLQFMSMRE